MYDGNGNRVEKYLTSGGTVTSQTVFVYDALGRMAAEYAVAVDTPPCVTCYLTPDHLGTPRLITDQNGNVVQRHDYMPFGEEVLASQYGRDTSFGSLNDSIKQKFTAKEKDSESGLDYFGARYYGSALGRFTSPDPVQIMKEKLADPQQWNMYAYVRNNPLGNVDPDGQACTALYGNSGSGFCTRATEYGKIDAISAVSSKTRFFAAANAVSQALDDIATPISGLFVSGQTASFLEGVGQKLEKLNQTESSEIQSGTLGGPNLDQRLVHSEQSAAQDQLNGLQQSDPAAYSKTISDINGLLNGLVTKGLEQLSGTDRAYAGVLAGVRKDLGRNIDFSKQSDREAIGNALIRHVRQTRRMRHQWRQAGWMQMIKRLLIWLLETLSEALLLGIVLTALLGHDQNAIFKDLSIYSSGILLMFLTTGYILTTVVVRAVWKGQAVWLYPTIATGLFLIHFEIMNVLVRGAFAPSDRLRICAAGTSIVVVCTIAGSLALRRWAPTPRDMASAPGSN